MSASKTATHAPLRSLDQRMDALKRANDVRVKRAKLKKDLKDGKVRIEQILGNPPEYVSTAKGIDILMAVPKLGVVEAGRITTVLVVTGPSGAGKGTLIRELVERVPGIEVTVSATTRERRRGEENGREYWFLTDEDFLARIAQGEFLEHVEYVSGHRYGTLRSELDRIAAKGLVPLLELETKGALRVQDGV